MSVILIYHTNVGNVQSGSVIYMSIEDSKKYIERILPHVDVMSRYPGTYWFQDGAILQLFPKGSIAPQSGNT
jgi:hypothetical protein